MKRHSVKRISVINICICVVLGLYALSLFSILGWAVLTSLKSTLDFNDMRNVLGLPDGKLSASEIKLGNYLDIISKFELKTASKNYISSIWGEIVRQKLKVGFFGMLFNSLLYAGVGNLLYTFVSMLMG